MIWPIIAWNIPRIIILWKVYIFHWPKAFKWDPEILWPAHNIKRETSSIARLFKMKIHK